MPAILEEMKAASTNLTAEERIELIDFLDNASHEERDIIREEWSKLAQKRLAEHEAGTRLAVPFNTVFKRLSVG